MTEGIIVKSFEYKIRETKKFVDAAEKMLDHCCFLYNCALEQRIGYYRRYRANISFYEQNRQLTEARKDIDGIDSFLRQIQYDTLRRLDFAFTRFFRRIRENEKVGLPRFKNRSRYKSFTQSLEKRRIHPLNGDLLTIPGIGEVRVRLSRPVLGRVKQITVIKKIDGWHAILVCETQSMAPLSKTHQTVGIDVGLKNFATFSTGEVTPNPKFFYTEQKSLAKLNSRFAKRKIGSKRRIKANEAFRRLHDVIANRRRDFHHKLALAIVARFDCIYVEALNISGMRRHPKFSRAVHDVAWGQFFRILKYKAENAGREFNKVDPRYTSMTCSNCGERRHLLLKERAFSCGACGFGTDRDHNAAINIGRGAPKSKLVERHRGAMKRERWLPT